MAASLDRQGAPPFAHPAGSTCWKKGYHFRTTSKADSQNVSNALKQSILQMVEKTLH
jgi:hypothetical protein